MALNFRSWLFALRSSFWLLPSAISLACLVAGYLIMDADKFLHGEDTSMVPMITMPIESARLALSTTAGSMITIASLVFSMTLVSLTLVSQQFGPRILMRFMDDRETQVVLGLFIGTFLFSLVVLLRLGAGGTGGKITSLAVLAAAALTIGAMGMMIRFIHHIATRIQADVLIAELGEELNSAVMTFAELEQAEDAIASKDDFRRIDEIFDASTPDQVVLDCGGYLRTLNSAKAAELAMANSAIIRLRVRPGDFLLTGVPILDVVHEDGDTLDDDFLGELESLLSVGDRRTPEASIEFEIDALVEFALRALSPGINDPFTAKACIDRLTEGLCALLRRRTERRVTRDQQDNIRILHKEEPFERYLEKAYCAISQAAGDSLVVRAKLKHSLKDLSHVARQEMKRTDLARQCDELLAEIAG